MTLHQLSLFRTVAETRSISETSARFRITQPAVTRQLQALAREYRTRLYVTTGRGVELTQEGERFLQHAHNVLSAVGQLEREFRPISAPSQEQLMVGACFPAAAAMIPAVVSDFVKSFPAVKVHLTIDPTMILLPSILSGKLDLAVVLSLPADTTALQYEIVAYYTPVLVGPADHALTHKKRATAHDLRDIPLILHRHRPISEKLIAVMQNTGIEPRIEMECLSAEGVKTAVKSGLGFGLLFEEHISDEIRTGSLQPVNLRIFRRNSIPCYAVHSANRTPEPALQSFVDLLRDHGRRGLA